jgi:Tfp pilus assembly protein PilF
LDHAGPDRNLGMLYRDAPSIGSIGNRTLARKHLERAVELDPDYPDNRLSLIEGELKWGDRKDARNQLEALEAAWPRAKTNLSSPAFAANWAEWETQLRTFKHKIEESNKPLTSPRDKK